MKKVLLVLFIMAFAANMMFAGTPMTNQGDKSLGFVVGGLGTFNVSGGGPANGFSARYYLSKDMGLRLGVGFQSGKVEPTGATKTDATSMGIAPALVWNMAPVAGSIAPYWGVEASYNSTKNSQTTVAGEKTEWSYNGFGAGVLMGAEWYAWDGISFNAEYNLMYTSLSGERKNPDGTTTDFGTATSMGIGTWAVGLNVYIGN